MASVKDYLKKLLYQYDCVVVPELGAFLTHYQPASYTETSGLYLPPRKRVAFNEALRLDDGILANYIMLHEPVTREGAQRYISTFVGDLHQRVQATGHFEIDGIGTFSHNDEGRLQFDPSLRHNFFGEAYGMSAIPAQMLNRQPLLEPALEAVPVTTALGPVVVREDDTTLVPLRRPRPYWRVAAAILLIGSIGLVSYLSVIKPGQPFQSSLNPANLFHSPVALSVRSTEVENPSKPVLIPKNAPVPTPAPTPKLVPRRIEPVAVAPKPATKTKSVVAPAGKIAPAVVTAVAKPVRTAPHYTVIAGSFSSKRNALRLRRQLRKSGYTDAFVIVPSQKGQLYKVAAAGSANRSEAVASMAAISELARTETWIYKN